MTSKLHKSLKIIGIRASLLGDNLMSEPMTRYLKKRFPNCFITWVISERLKQGVPFFINHPHIDQTYTCKGKSDGFSAEDLEKFSDYDIIFDVTPQHPNGDSWYGKYTCVEETVRMSYGDWAKKWLDLNSPDELLADFKKTLTEQEQKPRLYPWWDEKRYKDLFKIKTIGIWPVAGYGLKNLDRNPSQEFYEDLIFELQKEGYAVAIFGHPKDFELNGNYNFKDRSLFEQIQISLATNLIINTDSGSGWYIGAYGHPQISLIKDGYPNGRPDFWPLAPENWAGKNKVLTSCNDWSSVTVEKVMEKVEEHGI